MSTSLLYHAYNLREIKYKSTKYENRQITYHAEMKNSYSLRICPKCAHDKAIFKGKKERILKILPIGNKKCFLSLILHRLKCKNCNHLWTPHLPFMNGKSKLTKSLVTSVLDLLRMGTISCVANFFGLSWGTVKDIHKKRLKILFKKIHLKDLEYIGMDEFSILKGHKYMTIFTDLKTGRIIHAVRGRKEENIAPFLKKLGKRGVKLKAIAMDMSKSYRAAVKKHLPDIDIVFDHFHVSALINKAVDKVRREESKKISKTMKQVFKGKKYLFLKNYLSLDINGMERLNTLLDINYPLFKAYVLKEQFRWFWKIKKTSVAIKFLKAWCTDAILSGVKELGKLAKTIFSHAEGLLNYFTHRISTGPVEGINNKIKTMKRQAYGFRDMDYFKLRLYNLHNQGYKLI